MRSKNKYHSPVTVLAIALMALLMNACHKHKGADSAGKEDTTGIAFLAASPSEVVLSQQATIRFGEPEGYDSVALRGYIIPDERRTNVVSARVNGRVEKLYVRFPGEYIRKGQKLLDLYSPELTTAISEFLFLSKKDSLSPLTLDSKKKLLLLGLTSGQLDGIAKIGTAPQYISLYSPFEGYLVNPENESMRSSAEQPGLPMTGTMNNMGGSDRQQTPASSGELREGSYVVSGQSLFHINDAQVVAARMSVPVAAQALITAGIPVKVTSELRRGEILSGTVYAIEPVITPEQRFVFARVTLANSKQDLMFNSLVNAVLPLEREGQPHRLPASCVMDLGKREIVWVKTNTINGSGVFVPRVVSTGVEQNGFIEIISGIQTGEEIALQSGLMTDRESIIETGIR